MPPQCLFQLRLRLKDGVIRSPPVPYSFQAEDAHNKVQDTESYQPETGAVDEDVDDVDTCLVLYFLFDGEQAYEGIDGLQGETEGRS